jgi:hypothetical protein
MPKNSPISPRMISILTRIILGTLTLALPLDGFASDYWTNIRVKELPASARTQLLRDIKDFARRSEVRHPDRYATILNENRIPGDWLLPLLLPTQAHASAPSGFCLYGGWPSTWTTDGRKLCNWPQSGNPAYRTTNGSTCSDRQLLCNPTLFGDALCVPFETREQRKSPFTACDKLFVESGRN